MMASNVVLHVWYYEDVEILDAIFAKASHFARIGDKANALKVGVLLPYVNLPGQTKCANFENGVGIFPSPIGIQCHIGPTQSEHRQEN